MRLINHHQIEVAPVQRLQVNPINNAGFAGQIGVREYRISKTVFQKWIQFTDILRQINCPVLAQFLGTEYQHPVIAQFKILDNGQRQIRFSQPHTVSDNTAIVPIDFMNRALNAILLEIKQRFPDLGINNRCLIKQRRVRRLAGQKLFKDMEQGLEVNKLRRGIDIELFEIEQHLRLDILHQLRIVP